MIASTLFPRPDVRLQWRRSLGLLTTTSLTMVAFVWVCVYRIVRVAPLLQARLSPADIALVLLSWLFGACLITILFVTVDQLSRMALRGKRGRRWFQALQEPGAQGEPIAAIVGAIVLALAAWAAMKWLAMPFSWGEKPLSIPLISPKAGRYLWPLAGILFLEAGLALVWLLRGRDARWWMARAAVGLIWCLLILWVITGPNLLRGDTLEWAERLGGSDIPQAWLSRAPRVPGGWWPAIQVGLAGSLMVTLVGVAKEMREAWRGLQQKRRTTAATAARPSPR